MSNTVGQDTSVYLQNGIKDRYFYGLRRTDEGTLFIGKVDQLGFNDPVAINNPGNIDDNGITLVVDANTTVVSPPPHLRRHDSNTGRRVVIKRRKSNPNKGL